MPQKPILLIASDALTSCRPQAFGHVPLGDELLPFASANDALSYMTATRTGQNAAVPGLVLVWSTVGNEAISKLISHMRSEEPLARIPIVVLTDASDDRMQTLTKLAANSFLVNVGNTEALLDLVSKYFPKRARRTPCSVLSHRDRA